MMDVVEDEPDIDIKKTTAPHDLLVPESKVFDEQALSEYWDRHGLLHKPGEEGIL